MTTSTILTPCIQVCVLDRESGLCIGCGRTGEEIGSWRGLDDSQRRRIMSELPDRLARLTTDRQQLGGSRAKRESLRR